MTTLNKLENKLNPFSYTKGIFIFASIGLAITLLSGLVQFLFENYFEFEQNPIEESNKVILFIVAIILAPIIETLIFQFLIIEIVYAFLIFIKLNEKICKCIFAILISSIAFGIAHNIHVLYMITAFFMGFQLAFLYIYYRTRFGRLKAFFACLIVHSLVNLSSFILNFIENTFF